MEYEMLFFQIACGFTLAMEESHDVKISVRMGKGIKIISN